MSDWYLDAFAFTIHVEKGFVDNPDDSGGPTKYGVTIPILAAYRHDICTRDDILNLNLGEAQDLYRCLFWNPLRLSLINAKPICMVLFDASVLFGYGVTVLCAQKALQMSGFPLLITDGKVGPRTLNALNSVDAKPFILSMHSALSDRIAEIEARYPKDSIFENGWKNRIDSYLNL